MLTPSAAEPGRLRAMKSWEETWTAAGPHVESDAPEAGEFLRSTLEHEPSSEGRARLAAAAPDLVRALLVAEQWSGACVCCGKLHRVHGHHATCALDAALRKAGVR